MQVGAENRTKLFAMIVLALVGVFMLVRAFTSADNVTAAPSTPKPAATGPVRSAAQVKRQAPNAQAQSLDPTIRLDLLAASEGIKYEGHGRNIFRAEAEAPPKPIVLSKEQQCRITPDAPMCAPPGPPPPPPINLKFFGFANRAGERKRVFLSQGADVFIAGEGETVNRRYKVMKIGVNSVEIQDVLNNNTQTIPLTQG